MPYCINCTQNVFKILITKYINIYKGISEYTDHEYLNIRGQFLMQWQIMKMQDSITILMKMN